MKRPSLAGLPMRLRDAEHLKIAENCKCPKGQTQLGEDGRIECAVCSYSVSRELELNGMSIPLPNGGYTPSCLVRGEYN